MTFVTSTSAVSRHGAYAIERQPPATIQATGTGVACLVGQFPWGPDGADDAEPHQPADAKDRALTFAPPGMDRTGDGYLSIIRKAWPDLRLVRVLGATASKASAGLDEGATEVVVVEAKYKGAAGNSIDCIVSDASDGDANHFDLEVRVTGASGTTSDFFQNLNYSGTGDDSAPVLTEARLVGAITKSNAGRPDNGTTTMATGSDGTITAADYVGTAGSGDKGIALAENDKAIEVIFTDDPGNSLRAAVNAGLVAHQILMGDRVAVVFGDSGVTSITTVQTDAGSYRAVGIVYIDPWVYIYDDTDGSLRLVSPSSFVASVIAQLPPSTSIAWKSSVVKAMLQGIVKLETPRGNGAGSNTKAGVATFIKEAKGGHTIEAGVCTIAPANPAKKNLTRIRTGIYIAKSFTDSVREMVDAPNVPLNQDTLVAALVAFMSRMKKNATTNPNALPHVLDYAVLDLAAENSTESLAAGDFFIPLDVKTSSAMERIFLSIRFGESVEITAS